MKELFLQSLRFGSVGLVNSAIGLSAIWIAMWLGLSPLAANAVGYAIGIVISFTLNRIWTFRDLRGARPAKSHGEAVRFGVSFILAYALNFVVVWIALETTSISPNLLQIAGMITFTATFFVLCRAWVFAKAPKDHPTS